MEKVKTLWVYNLVNSNGNKLQLELGHTDVQREGNPWSSADKGYRWRFIGKHIPMPVRSLYWFNGFPEHIMIDWLKGNGWYVRTRVDVGTGYVEVCELPNGNKLSGIEDASLKHALRLLWQEGLKLKACGLYKLVYGGTLAEATVAVREIVDPQDETCYN